jgi:peroxiredoxin
MVAAATLTAQETKMPKVGDKAPVVSGKNEKGATWNLADSVGKKDCVVVLLSKR